MQYYFRIPFAATGDKQAVPETPQADGSVSFPVGWGPDYQKDLKTKASAKAVERGVMNNMLNMLSQAMRELQGSSFPDWITPAQNGGTAFQYRKGTAVTYNGVSYISTADGNGTEPGATGAAWQEFAWQVATQAEVDEGTGDFLIVTPPTLKANLDARLNDITKTLAPFLLPVGCIIAWPTNTPPAGWIEANGQGFDMGKNPELSKVFPGGAVPDLRGRFIRGWAHGSTVDPDPGRGVLSEQAPADMSHYHVIGRFHAESGAAADDVSFPVRTQDWHGQSYPSRACFGDASYAGRGSVPEGGSGETVSTANPVRMDGSPGMLDPHPANTALMYIVKTDSADNIAPEPTPTNIIVTPSSLTIGVGQQRQFSAQVLPVDLAPKYPVTWLSTNTAAGTIDQNGLYTSTGTGTTDIIASVSTGLSVRVTVNNYVLLTNIAMGAIPDQLAGTTYQLQITRTPANATEPVTFASSDGTIAQASADGLLQSFLAGNATISVTGNISNKTASRPVVVRDNPQSEKYLQIEKNLSEIKGNGAPAQAEARDNLGLGELAIKDSLAAPDVGAVPLSATVIPAATDLNSMTTPGEYWQDVQNNVTAANHYPVPNVPGVLKVWKRNAANGQVIQEWRTGSDPVQVWLRSTSGSPIVWSDWKRIDAGASGASTVTIMGNKQLDASAEASRRAQIANPFPGHNVAVQFECNPLGTQWGAPGWGYSPTADSGTSLPAGMAGVTAGRLNVASGSGAGDWIVITGGPAGICHRSDITGTPMSNITGPIKLVNADAWRIIVTDLGAAS